MIEKLKEAMAIVTTSLSHIESLKKELNAIQLKLSKKSEELIDVTRRNIKLSDHLSSLKKDNAQLELKVTRLSEDNTSLKDELASLKNARVPEVKASQPKKVEAISGKSDPLISDAKFRLNGLTGPVRQVVLKTRHIHDYTLSKLNISEQELRQCLFDSEIDTYRLAVARIREIYTNRPEVPVKPAKTLQEPKCLDATPGMQSFSLYDVSGNCRQVLRLTKHIHNYLVSRLDISELELRQCMDAKQIPTYQLAVRQILAKYSDAVKQANNDSLAKITPVEPKIQEVTRATRVSKEIRLVFVEVPEFLEEIKRLTIDVFSSEISVGKTLELGLNERKQYPVPVAVTLSGLQSHLKKRIRNKSVVSLTEKPIASPEAQDGEPPKIPKECPILGPTEIHVTHKGKELRGWFIDFLSKEEVTDIDPYTFVKEGRWFVREKWQKQLIDAIQAWSNTSFNPAHEVKEVIPVEAPIEKRVTSNVASASSTELSVTSVKLLDTTFKLSAKKMPLDELFAVNKLNVAINSSHPFLVIAKPCLSNQFWESFNAFVCLWAMVQNNGISASAVESSEKAKTYFSRALKIYASSKALYSVELGKLPHNQLFSYRSGAEGITVIVNNLHPFNENYLLRLSDAEQQVFAQMYSSWLYAEQTTLSDNAEQSLVFTRELLGTHFYHLVDEIMHGEEEF